VMYYDEAAEEVIISYFDNTSKEDDTHQTTSNGQNEADQNTFDAQNDKDQTTTSKTSIDIVISMLKDELSVKNEQIRELNARLAESNAALVAAQQMAQAEQMLHAGTMQKQLKEGEENTPGPEATKKKGFFERFRKQ